jgi:hypothetical protein
VAAIRTFKFFTAYRESRLCWKKITFQSVFNGESRKLLVAVRAIKTPCSHSVASVLIHNEPIKRNRCTHIAVSLFMVPIIPAGSIFIDTRSPFSVNFVTGTHVLRCRSTVTSSVIRSAEQLQRWPRKSNVTLRLNWCQVLKRCQLRCKLFVCLTYGAFDGNRTHVRSLGGLELSNSLLFPGVMLGH